MNSVASSPTSAAPASPTAAPTMFVTPRSQRVQDLSQQIDQQQETMTSPYLESPVTGVDWLRDNHNRREDLQTPVMSNVAAAPAPVATPATTWMVETPPEPILSEAQAELLHATAFDHPLSHRLSRMSHFAESKDEERLWKLLQRLHQNPDNNRKVLVRQWLEQDCFSPVPRVELPQPFYKDIVHSNQDAAGAKLYWQYLLAHADTKWVYEKLPMRAGQWHLTTPLQKQTAYRIAQAIRYTTYCPYTQAIRSLQSWHYNCAMECVEAVSSWYHALYVLLRVHLEMENCPSADMHECWDASVANMSLVDMVTELNKTPVDDQKVPDGAIGLLLQQVVTGNLEPFAPATAELPLVTHVVLFLGETSHPELTEWRNHLVTRYIDECLAERPVLLVAYARLLPQDYWWHTLQEYLHTCTQRSRVLEALAESFESDEVEQICTSIVNYCMSEEEDELFIAPAGSTTFWDDTITSKDASKMRSLEWLKPYPLLQLQATCRLLRQLLQRRKLVAAYNFVDASFPTELLELETDDDVYQNHKKECQGLMDFLEATKSLSQFRQVLQEQSTTLPKDDFLDEMNMASLTSSEVDMAKAARLVSVLHKARDHATPVIRDATDACGTCTIVLQQPWLLVVDTDENGEEEEKHQADRQSLRQDLLPLLIKEVQILCLDMHAWLMQWLEETAKVVQGPLSSTLDRLTDGNTESTMNPCSWSRIARDILEDVDKEEWHVMDALQEEDHVEIETNCSKAKVEFERAKTLLADFIEMSEEKVDG